MQARKLHRLSRRPGPCSLGTAPRPRCPTACVKIGVLTDLSGHLLRRGRQWHGAWPPRWPSTTSSRPRRSRGFKVELVSADHQNKADIAANKAREWFEQGKVDAATELVATSVALAVQKIAKEKNRIALISGAALHPRSPTRTATTSPSTGPTTPTRWPTAPPAR